MTPRGRSAGTACRAAITVALAAHVATQSAVVAQSVDSLVRPATPLDAALVQIARFYRQPIGFERVTGDVASGDATLVDLSRMTLDDALTAVVARAPRPYRAQREDGIVSVRPSEGATNGDLWLNQAPGAPGLVIEPIRSQPRQVPGDPYYRVTNTITFQLHLLPSLVNLTLAESWLELERPGP